MPITMMPIPRLAASRSKPKKGRKRPSGKKPGLLGRLLRLLFTLLLKIALWISLLAILLLAGYAYYLDRTITKTFEGRRWSIPAQVYAQPLELFSGRPLGKDALVSELERLGYRASDHLDVPGLYRTSRTDLQVHLRGFSFADARRPAQRLSIAFAGNRISNIKNPRGGDIGLIRVDPATIGSFFPSHGEDRLILRPDEVPPLLAQGLKAVEDREFDTHRGFSISGIARAALVNFRSGEARQGGSTLTQQLVKSYFLTNERSIQRKLRELAMSIILELRFTKEDLLTAYINEIFLGQNGARAIHGFGLGAQYYFNKPLNELAVDQIATLISIIRGPSYYNPLRHPERTLRRRNRILDTFLADGLISNSLHQDAIGAPLGVTRNSREGGTYYPGFMDLVRSELTERYSAADLRTQGLRIFTTLRPQIQEAAQRAVSDTLDRLEKDRGLEDQSLEAAMIVTDTQTGDVHALIGGRKGQVDGFNRVLNAKRPVGSVIKPVIALTALEQGYDWHSLVKDEAITLTSDGSAPWSPRNYDGKTRGDVPLIRALALSLNLAMIDLGQRVGLLEVQRTFTRLLGKAPGNRYPSFFLGAESMSPLQLAELYGNFASAGFRTPPKSVITVLDEENRPLSHYPFQLDQTIDSGVVNSLNRGLEVVMRRGTGRASSYAQAGIAGKTGTTNDNRDSWFAGFDSRSLAVVWVGRDDNKPMGLTGSSGALRIWDALQQQIPPAALQPSETQTLVPIEYLTGLRANEKCADVVELPIRQPDTLSVKAGCGLKPGFGRRLRALFGNNDDP
tara:strand:+ start:20316 stop:22694 length:2379 start_codon:yes stop_codon:yes gene_type:complete